MSNRSSWNGCLRPAGIRRLEERFIVDETTGSLLTYRRDGYTQP